MPKRRILMLATAVPTVLVALSGCSERARTPTLPAGSDRIVRAERPVAEHYLVRLAATEGASDPAAVAQDLASRNGATVLHVYASAFRGFSMRGSAAAAGAIALDGRVARVEEDAVTSAASVTSQSSPPWSLDRVDQHVSSLDDLYTFDDAWAGQGVHAYVLDTGVLTTHTQFFPDRASFAFDALGENATGDCSGHGTHVAGTIAGLTYGVAKAVRVHSVRVLDCTGNGKVSDVVAGIDWVIANHQSPAVANLSVFSGASPALDDAVEAAVAQGIVVVAAAGDGGKDACDVSPARAPGAITVAAMEPEPPTTVGGSPRDVLAPYSNVGDCVDLVAPGTDIVSAWNTSTVADLPLSGTSMAAPHVAGAAALYLSRFPAATPAEVVRALVAGSTRAPVGATPFTPDRLLYSRAVELAAAPDPDAAVTITTPLPDAQLAGTVTVAMDAENAVTITRVELLVDGRWRGTADTTPYEITWDTSTAIDGAHTLVARAYDAGGNAVDSAPVPVSVSNPGVAHFDPALRIARCETLAPTCDSRDIVRGRAALGPERYAPSALRDPCESDPTGCLCQDGPTGAYRVDESVERIVVTSGDGSPLATGGNVRVDVDVFVGSDLGDFLDVYASPAVSPSAWRHVITLEPVASGQQTLTAQYTLASGATQAIRAAFRHGGAEAICTEGGYDDRDDLAFEVGAGNEDTAPPTVAILAPGDGDVLSGTSDVEVAAQDDRLVAKVVVTAESHFEGKTYPVAQLTSAPYQYAWQSALLPNGWYTLHAVAYDGAGHTAADQVDVTLADVEGPVCAITSPAPGAVLDSNLVHVDATAVDAGTVQKLDVLVNDVVQGTDTFAPWAFEFRVPANGDYVLKVRGTDLQGNVAESAPVSVQVNDVNPPVLTVLRPTDGATVTGTVTFEVDAADESGIDKVLLYFDGELLGTATGAPYQIAWDSTRALNGTYTFAATAFDGVGNVATTSVSVVRDDHTPPTVAVTDPQPDAVLAGTVVVAASASDDSAVEHVDFLLLDPVASTSTVIGTATEAPYSIVWATGTVAPGTWELYARAWDYAGNEATSDPSGAVTVTVAGDSTPPVTAIVAPADGLEWVTGSLRVAATADDPGGQLVKVELRADGTPFATLTAAPFEAVLDTVALANGTHELTSKAYDLAGNAGVSAPVTISVSNPGAIFDPVLGTPSCDAPRALCHTGLLLLGRGPLGPEANAPNTVDGCPDGMQGEYLVDESIEHIAISSLDAGDLTAGKLARIDVRAVIADPIYDRLDVYAAADPAAPEFVLIGSFDAPTAAGEQTLSATVPLLGSTRQVIRLALRGGGPAEACGTTGYDDRDDVVIAVQPGVPDTTPPAVAITAPAPGSSVRDPVAVTASATDDVGVTRVEFRVNGVPFGEDFTPPYEATWDPAGLVPTTYQLTAVAFDLAGNSTESAPVPVAVEDVIPPTCTITSPIDEDTVNGTITVQATAADDVGVTQVELFQLDPAGNETLVASDPSAPYAFSIDTAALQDGGTYRLVARAHDAGGNVGGSTPVAFHVTRTGLAAWDRKQKAPACATAGIQCWTGSLVVGRGPLGPEPKAPNTIGSSCADGASGYFHIDESSDAIAVRAQDLAVGLKAGAAVRIEVKVWATASYPTDHLDVFVADNAKAPVWTLLGTLTPSRAGAQVLAIDHVLGAGTQQAVRAQFRHAGSAAGGCSAGEFDDHDDLIFAVSQ